MSERIITLLTDFGSLDVYVGVLKGVIASINPQLRVIDLTHEIPPQNLAAARFALMNAFAYFPDQTIHLAVVDPGVGSNRRSLAIKFARAYLVGPDNGIFSGILSLSSAIKAVSLTNSDYWRVVKPSATFHGRDIFAPVAAHLATGVPIEELGEEVPIDSLVPLAIPQFYHRDNTIVGYIQYIDVFGNLISNIPASAVEGKSWSVVIKDLTVLSANTYSDVEKGKTLALVSSEGWIEIATNGGSAKLELKVEWGDSLVVIFE